MEEGQGQAGRRDGAGVMATTGELRTYFNEVSEAMSGARNCAKVAVSFAAGKLRSMYLDAETLRELKRELHGYNAKRGKWIS